MRTLKKTLCLVLALVMVLGLGAFGVSAVEYEDADEITAAYDEAIQLLAGLNVMQGNNGNFLPKETLDRAAAAVILTKLALGGADVPNMPASFKDVDESYAWASNYIGYAQAQGYIKGYNDEYFGPADPLTGAQWGIMLLRVLGYVDANEDFSSGFELGVAKLVSMTKLADGDSGFDVTKPITREEVAQLAFNSLTVPEVRYTSTLGASGGELTNVYERTTDGVAEEHLADRFGLAVDPVAGTEWAKDEIGGGSIVYGVITENSSVAEVETTQLNGNGTKYKINTGVDMLGHYVKIYKDKNTATKVLGIVDESTVVEVASSAAVGTAAKFSAAFGAAYATVKATADSIVKVSDEGAVTTANDCTGNGEVFGASVAAVTPGTYILDSEGNVKAYIAVPAVTLDKVYAIGTTAGAETITLASATGTARANNATSDVVNEYDGIAKDDYVTVLKYGAIYNLAPVHTVTGTVSKVNITSGVLVSVVMDGTTYAVSSVTGDAGLAAVDFTAATPTNLKNNEYTLYLTEDDELIVATLKDVEEATPDLVYLVAAYSTPRTPEYDEYGMTTDKATWTLHAQCIDMNGNQVVYETIYTGSGTGSVLTPATGAFTPATAGFYTVTVAEATDNQGDSAGHKAEFATFEAVTTTAAAGTKAIVKNVTDEAIAAATTKSIDSAYGSGKLYFSSNQKVFYVSGTGTNLKVTSATGLVDIAADTVYKAHATKTDAVSTNYTVDYIVVATAEPAASGTGVLYVPAGAAYKESNASGYVYDLYLDGVETELTLSQANLSSVDSDVRGHFVTYTVANDVYTITEKSAAEKVGALLRGYDVVGNYATTKNATTGADIDADVAISAATVVDLRDVTTPITDVAGIAAATTTTFTVNYVKATSGITYLYITDSASNVSTLTSASFAAYENVTFTIEGTTLTLGGTEKNACTINGANGALLDGKVTLPTGATAKVYSDYTNENTNTANEEGALVAGDKLVVKAEDGITITVYTVAIKA